VGTIKAKKSSMGGGESPPYHAYILKNLMSEFTGISILRI